MKFVRSCVRSYGMVQCCVNDTLAEKVIKAGLPSSVSKTPFLDIPVVSCDPANWQFDEKGNILGLEEYKEDE